ncbi:MAG: hypothetical protein M1820_008204, partial [Bogoriella megaspora]
IEDFEEAVRLDRRTLQQREDLFGVDEDGTCNSRKNLACNLFYLGKFKEAQTLFQKNVEIKKKLSSLGRADLIDDDSDSEQWLEDCATARKELEAKDHKHTHTSPERKKAPKKASNSLEKAKATSPSLKVDNSKDRKRSASASSGSKRRSADAGKSPSISAPIPHRIKTDQEKAAWDKHTRTSLNSDGPGDSSSSSQGPRQEVRKSRSDLELKPASTSKSSLGLENSTELSRSGSTSSQKGSRQPNKNAFPKLFDVRDGIEGHIDSATADEWFEDLEEKTQSILDEGRQDENGRPTLGRRIKIAILDTEIDMEHPDMKSYKQRIKGRKSWVDSGKDDEDTCGHGTHAAALVLKVARKAYVYIARVVRGYDDKDFQTSNVVQAIQWARDQSKVDIITMSMGMRHDDEIASAINYAAADGILFFAAASNVGATKLHPIAFPAKLNNVISIGSANGNGRRSEFNPYDPGRRKINYNALGEQVKAAWPKRLNQGTHRRMSGTSTAAPIAAAIAALSLEFVYSERPFRNPMITQKYLQGIRKRIKSFDGMSSILDFMVVHDDQHDWILPSVLFDASRAEELECTVGDLRESAMQKLREQLFS